MPTTSSEYLDVSVTAVNWTSTTTLFAYCVAIPSVTPLPQIAPIYFTDHLLDTIRFVLYTVRKVGLRGANIVTSVLIFVGNWIRYAGTVKSVRSYGVIIFGHILTAFAQPFCLSTPTKFSDTWFTESGRTSATAFTTLANPLGAAIGQFVGSVLAPSPDKVPQMVLVVAIIVSLVVYLGTSVFVYESASLILLIYSTSRALLQSPLFSSPQGLLLLRRLRPRPIARRP